jgi:hypothetical protein
MIITIILKPNSGSIRGKTRVISQGLSHKSGQTKLTQVNVRIKIIIIIVLKSNLEVDPGQDPDREWG